MTKNHNCCKGGQFPPDFDFEQAERSSQRGNKSNRDPEADEGHHAGLVVRNLVPRSADKDKATVKENNRSENRCK